MTEISCFYIHLNRGDISLIFTKYNNYYLISIDRSKSIILSYKTFMKIPFLYEIYILSLLLTENTQEMRKINNNYIISTKKLYKGRIFNDHYDDVIVGNKNPLNKNEPTRESSYKKIKKFAKRFEREFENYYPFELIDMFIYDEIYNTQIPYILEEYYHANTIQLLTGIKKKYGRDIYDIIRNYL